MYYEVYIDVLFLINFMMDYFLLGIIKKVLRCSATHWRIFLGAVLGAALMCLVFLLQVHPYIKLFLYHMVANTAMLLVGLHIKSIKSFFESFVLLYTGSFLMGGILEIFQPYTRIAGLFVLLAAVSYEVIWKIFEWIKKLYRINEYYCKATLYWNGKKCHVRAVIDTGNHLREPSGGKPVHVIDKSVFLRAFEKEKVKNLQYVCYHSIGKKEDFMPVIRIDRICLHRESDCWLEMPYLAIGNEEITLTGKYEMIINPAAL